MTWLVPIDSEDISRMIVKHAHYKPDVLLSWKPLWFDSLDCWRQKLSCWSLVLQWLLSIHTLKFQTFVYHVPSTIFQEMSSLYIGKSQLYVYSCFQEMCYCCLVAVGPQWVARLSFLQNVEDFLVLQTLQPRRPTRAQCQQIWQACLSVQSASTMYCPLFCSVLVGTWSVPTADPSWHAARLVVAHWVSNIIPNFCLLNPSSQELNPRLNTLLAVI